MTCKVSGVSEPGGKAEELDQPHHLLSPPRPQLQVPAGEPLLIRVSARPWGPLATTQVTQDTRGISNVCCQWRRHPSFSLEDLCRCLFLITGWAGSSQQGREFLAGVDILVLGVVWVTGPHPLPFPSLFLFSLHPSLSSPLLIKCLSNPYYMPGSVLCAHKQQE